MPRSPTSWIVRRKAVRTRNIRAYLVGFGCGLLTGSGRYAQQWTCVDMANRAGLKALKSLKYILAGPASAVAWGGAVVDQSFCIPDRASIASPKSAPTEANIRFVNYETESKDDWASFVAR